MENDRPTTFTKFRARPAKWGQRGGGLKSVLNAGAFFVTNTRRLFGNFATADFRQIWPRQVNRAKTKILDINLLKVSSQGSFAPKTWMESNIHFTQSRLQVKE